MASVEHDQTRTVTASINEATAGRIGWPAALAEIARNLNIASVAIETLDGAEQPSQAILASPQFKIRWESTFSDAARVVTTDRASLSVTKGALCVAIDTSSGFYGLVVEGLTSFDRFDDILACATRLGPALEIEQRILACQQDFALGILNSGGTAAFVLRNDGATLKMNECGRLLLAECRQARPGKPDADIASLLEIDPARLSQSNVVAPSGRRLMTYLVSWSSSIPAARHRLLVAWDIRIEAPMTSYWGDKTLDAVARAVRETFGLTKTESQLAVRLIGSDLRTAASDAGMAYETARSHLKSMFARMKVKSQSELIGLLSRFAYHERLRNTFGG